MCLHDWQSQVPKAFDINSLNQFWTWPHYNDYRNSFAYLAMTAMEKSDEVKRGALGEQTHLINAQKWNELPSIVNKDDLYDTFDKSFMDEESFKDFLVPAHKIVHFVHDMFDPLFSQIDGTRTNNVSLDSFAKGVFEGLAEIQWKDSVAIINKQIDDHDTAQKIEDVLKKIFQNNLNQMVDGKDLVKNISNLKIEKALNDVINIAKETNILKKVA